MILRAAALADIADEKITLIESLNSNSKITADPEREQARDRAIKSANKGQ